MTQAAVVGLEWGTSLTGAIVRSDGQVLTPQSIITPSTPEAAFEASSLLIQNLIDYAATLNLNIVGIGVGAYGHVNARDGILHNSRLFKTWRDIAVADTLKYACQLPVRLTNAVQSAALLEYESGAAAGSKYALYMHIGHTIESAYLIDGAIFQGAAGSGSIGFLTADWRGEKPVPLDEVATIPAIQKLYYSRTRIDQRPSYEEIIQLAQSGHALAIKAIRDTARILGTVLHPVATLMETDLVVVGGDVPQIGPLWATAFEAAFYASRPPAAAPIAVRQAHYGAYSVLYSVGRLALRQFLPEG